MPIIWPLKEKISPPLFSQQRPRAFGNIIPPKIPVNLPWNAVDAARFGIVDRKFEPRVVHQLLPVPPVRFVISGVTKDKDGVILVSCQVYLFRTADNAVLNSTVSDSVTGTYSFSGVGQQDHFGVSYKAGVQGVTGDVSGTTVNTLRGS